MLYAENPASELDDYRTQVWAAVGLNKSLERIDKDDLVEEELEEAKELLEAESYKQVEATKDEIEVPAR